MNNSKLINILRTFSKSEMKEFEKLAASPFFNKGRNYIPFLRELKKFHPKFEDEKMTSEYIYSKAFPGKEYNKQVAWNMNSALFSMAEEFLMHVTLKTRKFTRNNLIEDEYYYRKLSKLCYQKIDEMEKDLESTGLGSNYFRNRTQMEICKSNLFFLEDKQQLAHNNAVKEGEYSILYHLTIISNVINNMYYSSLLYNSGFDTNIPFVFIDNLNLDKVIDYAKGKKYKFTFVMEMYYSLIMSAIRPDDTKYFIKAKEIFEKYSRQFEEGEREINLGILSNYCILRANRGEEYFARMLFELNLIQLKDVEEGIKELGKIFYIQIVRNALNINEVDWVKKFIEKYTHYLKPSFQKPIRRIAEAFLAFKMKKFDKVIEQLSGVRFIDTRDKYYVKSLTLMSYFELGEIIALDYNIENAKKFVQNSQSLGKLTRVNFNRFLDYLKKLLAAMEKNDAFEFKKLDEEIKNNKSIINYSWLVEKIEELKKGAV